MKAISYNICTHGDSGIMDLGDLEGWESEEDEGWEIP